ncbi:MAG: hypothetical protein IIA17_08875, partial [candidate division Zixibacteria bacterium]|nr:hypothetical protein [candidate division Zixibacteria bacterium]
MVTFSVKHGYKNKKEVQYEQMDNGLRVALWNTLELFFWNKREENASGLIEVGDYFWDQPLKIIVSALWIDLLNWSLDEMPPYWGDVKGELKHHLFYCEWHEVYSFVEYLAPLAENLERGSAQRFVERCNTVLKQQCSAWQFVKGTIIPISNEIELEEISSAMEIPFDSVRNQLQTALDCLSKRPVPDKRNCIKETISAVESLARKILDSKNETFGKLIPQLQKELYLHESNKETLRNYWKWTCEISRHGERD